MGKQNINDGTYTQNGDHTCYVGAVATRIAQIVSFLGRFVISNLQLGDV